MSCQGLEWQAQGSGFNKRGLDADFLHLGKRQGRPSDLHPAEGTTVAKRLRHQIVHRKFAQHLYRRLSEGHFPYKPHESQWHTEDPACPHSQLRLEAEP